MTSRWLPRHRQSADSYDYDDCGDDNDNNDGGDNNDYDDGGNDEG